MNQIYIYDGSFDRGDLGWSLVREGACRYGWERNLPYDFEDIEICRTDSGKPFFVNIPVAFSLSHSGAMWMCLFSENPCGLDVQIVEEDRDWKIISQRRYTGEEQHYVELWGVEGFYEIWVRKEAFGKCTGRGIFSEMPSMVDENIELCAQVEYGQMTYSFGTVAISPEVKCAYCFADATDHMEMDVELRILG